MKEEKNFQPRTMRWWLSWSGGSGKSTALATCVHHMRTLFRNEDIPVSIALTDGEFGWVALNVTFPGETCTSVIAIKDGMNFDEEGQDNKRRKLERQLGKIDLVMIDHVSIIGGEDLKKMQFEMQKPRTAFFSEQQTNPINDIFDGCSTIFVDHFHSLEPLVGGRHFLRSIHRSQEDVWWTQSCLRLRDDTCTHDQDYQLWKKHDLEQGNLTYSEKSYFHHHAVWLFPGKEDAAIHNGRKLADMASKGQLTIHCINAKHSHNSQKYQPSSIFDGLRNVIHLVVGSKVMLTRNIAPLCGLRKDTRGTVVGVLYSSDGQDAIGSFPKAIVVDAPTYLGPKFYARQRTWVPIIPHVAKKAGTNYCRHQFPLVPAFAMTIHQASGCSFPEGVVINLAGHSIASHPYNSCLAYVAFTRAQSFDRTAFEDLPTWHYFSEVQKKVIGKKRHGQSIAASRTSFRRLI